MFCFKDLSGCNLIGLSSSLSIYLCENLSEEEISALSAFFTTLGDNLALCIVNGCKDKKEETKEKKKEC